MIMKFGATIVDVLPTTQGLEMTVLSPSSSDENGYWPAESVTFRIDSSRISEFRSSLIKAGREVDNLRKRQSIK
jgi:hypothetical protein